MIKHSVSQLGYPRMFRSPLLRLLVVAVAICLGLMLATSPLFAQEIAAQNIDEEGCGCHSAESESWQHSPHSQVTLPGDDQQTLTCESCHGQYERGHPDSDLMSLSVDSSVCTECHVETHDQWEGSKHAEEGVQCIGCHLAHSQTLRLAEQELCTSCHRRSPDDAFHISHKYSDVECALCHVFAASNTSVNVSLDGDVSVLKQTPSHDFTAVSATGCIDCHAKQIRGEGVFVAEEKAITELMVVANRVPDLSAQLKAARDENSTLSLLTYVALGLGLGIGAVMGIIVVLFVGYVTRESSDEQSSS